MAEIKFRWPSSEDELMAKGNDRSRNTLIDIDPHIESTIPLIYMASLTMNR